MRLRFTGLACLIAVTTAAPALAADPRPSSLVSVFAGTDAGAPDFGTGGGAGNTFPGAVLPFGMVQFSPDTLPGLTAIGGGYSYGDRRIKGFSLKHMSGPGCAAYQDFPITPTTEPIPSSPVKPNSVDLRDRYVSRFAHAGERARPGLYRVRLGSIGVRLSATTRTGVARVTFPARRKASLLINAAGSAMGSRSSSVRISPRRREISGSVTSGQFCYSQNRYRLFFAARFDRPLRAYGTWRRDTLSRGSRSGSDAIPGDPFVSQPNPATPEIPRGTGPTAQTGAYASFDTRRRRAVEIRVGVSSVSVAGARRNLAAETEGAAFGRLESRAGRAWDSMLRRVEVRGGPRALRRLFYTQLYHATIHPSTFSDVDGRYRGFDGRVHDSGRRTVYADYSGWDTYRTQMPLLAMLAPRRASDMVRSLLAAERESGALPKWAQANSHTHVMVGDPADPLIAGAYAFGARDFDARAAVAAMVRGATRYRAASTRPDYFQRAGLPDYLRLGYVPHERNVDVIAATFQPEAVWGSAATTLEYAVADFAIARMAGAVCDRGTARTFMRRSGSWRNLFDPSSGYVQPRFANGAFKPVGAAGEEGFVEGNAAQYTLFVPQDPAGLFGALGGPAAAERRLDEFFREINAGPARPHAFLGNEPTLSTPWLYHWLGRPYKTQSIMRRALLGLYDNSPGGYPGNDDLGSMSSWWVLSALGLYPAVPGTDLLTIGTPLFPHAEVRLRGGTLAVEAPAAAPAAAYVHGVRLGGRPLARSWVRFGQLRGGARLRFDVGPRPARGFGSGSAPPSYGPGDVAQCRS
jgi:predicted alpha-1,2-mannosidase